jgi:hypothetical protein
MGKTAITIEIDEDNLTSYTDARLALCWHVAQANPADGFESSTPGDLAERIGREIIRRWLSKAPVELYHHQGRHYYGHQLGKFARFEPGSGESGSPEWHAGKWVPRATVDEAATSDNPGSVHHPESPPP